MRLVRSAALVGTAAAALALSALPAQASSNAPAPLQPWLAGQLTTAAKDAPMRVFVHGATPAGARSAATGAGLKVVEVFDKVAVAIAVGTPAQIGAVRSEPGVSYVEGDTPVVPLLDTAHDGTRSAEAVSTLHGTDGSKLDGSGVSIAIIDSGIDGTHP